MRKTIGNPGRALSYRGIKNATIAAMRLNIKSINAFT
jgi:hypothetical protein